MSFPCRVLYLRYNITFCRRNGTPRLSFLTSPSLYLNLQNKGFTCCVGHSVPMSCIIVEISDFLCLSDNTINPASIPVLPARPFLPQLRVLKLSRCRLTDEGLTALFPLLLSWTHLISLDIFRNPQISLQAMDAFIALISHLRFQTSAILVFKKLSFVPVPVIVPCTFSLLPSSSSFSHIVDVGPLAPDPFHDPRTGSLPLSPVLSPMVTRIIMMIQIMMNSDRSETESL